TARSAVLTRRCSAKLPDEKGISWLCLIAAAIYSPRVDCILARSFEGRVRDKGRILRLFAANSSQILAKFAPSQGHDARRSARETFRAKRTCRGGAQKRASTTT